MTTTVASGAVLMSILMNRHQTVAEQRTNISASVYRYRASLPILEEKKKQSGDLLANLMNIKKPPE